jgi:2-dehydropantoate 2-reductase
LRHVILGAGAVGGLIGAVLAHGGDDVTVLVRTESLAGHPRHLYVERYSGKIEAPVRIDTKLSGDADVLWIAVKAHQFVPALSTIPPDGLRSATIVPLLNGIEHVALLRSRFNQDCVVPATIAVESERLAPGRIIQRSPFVRLGLSSTGEHKLSGVAARFQNAGFSCEFYADEKTMLWSKLAFLAPFALTGTASGKDKSLSDAVSIPSPGPLIGFFSSPRTQRWPSTQGTRVILPHPIHGHCRSACSRQNNH